MTEKRKPKKTGRDVRCTRKRKKEREEGKKSACARGFDSERKRERVGARCERERGGARVKDGTVDGTVRGVAVVSL